MSAIHVFAKVARGDPATADPYGSVFVADAARHSVREKLLLFFCWLPAEPDPRLVAAERGNTPRRFCGGTGSRARSGPGRRSGESWRAAARSALASALFDDSQVPAIKQPSLGCK